MEQMYSLSCVAVKNLGCWTGPVPVGAGGMTHSGLWQHTGIPFCHWQEKPPAVPWMDTHIFQISNRIEKLPLFRAPCRVPSPPVCSAGGGSPRGGAVLPAKVTVCPPCLALSLTSLLILWLKLGSDASPKPPQSPEVVPQLAGRGAGVAELPHTLGTGIFQERRLLAPRHLALS